MTNQEILENKAKAWDIIYPHIYHIADLINNDKNTLYKSYQQNHIKYLDAIALALVIGEETKE